MGRYLESLQDQAEAWKAEGFDDIEIVEMLYNENDLDLQDIYAIVNMI